VESGLLGLVELLLVFGLVMWFGWSQLRALKRHDVDSADPDDRDRREKSED
jgi:hypothetical protein